MAELQKLVRPGPGSVVFPSGTLDPSIMSTSFAE